MASAIITESIPPERQGRLPTLGAGGINRAAESFPGYRETNVFPPLEADGREWITIIHFQSRTELEGWIGSEVRAQWVEGFHREFGDFTLHQVQGGLTSWFSQQRLPGWKMVLTVLLALYPTVMLITLVIMPWMGGCRWRRTCSSATSLSVSALQWILMPGLNRLAGLLAQAGGPHRPPQQPRWGPCSSSGRSWSRWSCSSSLGRWV